MFFEYVGNFSTTYCFMSCGFAESWNLDLSHCPSTQQTIGQVWPWAFYQSGFTGDFYAAMRKSLIRNAFQNNGRLAKVDVASSSLVTRSPSCKSASYDKKGGRLVRKVVRFLLWNDIRSIAFWLSRKDRFMVSESLSPTSIYCSLTKMGGSVLIWNLKESRPKTKKDRIDCSSRLSAIPLG